MDYNLEWAYGCPQAECLEFIYPTGELIYPVGAVIVMYNIESHSQRFYTGHTNLVTTLAIHPSATIVGKKNVTYPDLCKLVQTCLDKR